MKPTKRILWTVLILFLFMIVPATVWILGPNSYVINPYGLKDLMSYDEISAKFGPPLKVKLPTVGESQRTITNPNPLNPNVRGFPVTVTTAGTARIVYYRNVTIYFSTYDRMISWEWEWHWAAPP